MAEIAWACWDGGGNLNPGLGIAAELVARGHRVYFLGRPEMVDRVTAAGLPATALDTARADLERFAFHPGASVFGYTSSPAVGAELVQRVHELGPDAVVIDAMFSSACNVAPEFACPSAVMLHTFLNRLAGQWRNNLAMQSQMRVQAGFTALPDIDVLWGQRETLHVNTLSVFDSPSLTGWGNVVHGAPVLTVESRAAAPTLPWLADDPTPLVLLSFSTVPEQRGPQMLQRALDALAPLPVHVVATTGAIVDPGELHGPQNSHLLAFADHEQLMARAAFVVGHGGHGTAMRALRHGLPLIGIPAGGVDQVVVTEVIDEWGAGRALGPDPSEAQIRAAAAEVLSVGRYRKRAARLAVELAGTDGAARAADSVESILQRRRMPT